jgi:hypothetical protein
MGAGFVYYVRLEIARLAGDLIKIVRSILDFSGVLKLLLSYLRAHYLSS